MDEGFLRFFLEDLMALVDFEEVFFLLEDLLLFFGVLVWDFDLLGFVEDADVALRVPVARVFLGIVGVCVEMGFWELNHWCNEWLAVECVLDGRLSFGYVLMMSNHRFSIIQNASVNSFKILD